MGKKYKCHTFIFFIFCCAQFLSETKSELECPKGWSLFYPSQKCIKVSRDRKNWYEARKACQAMGADLVRIYNKAENEFVKGVKIGRDDPIMGLHRVNNVFKWLDDPNEPTYTNWARGQPDNHRNREHCGHMFSNGLWNDIACNHRTTYICETAAVHTAPITCPSGWTRYKRTCFQLVHIPKSWEDANNLCGTKMGHLAIINDAKTMDFLKANVLNINHGAYWIGLSDVKESNKYVWLNSTERTKYTNWARGEPNHAGKGQNCALVYGSSKMWNDDFCNAKRSLMCQRSADFDLYCDEKWDFNSDYKTCTKKFPVKQNWNTARSSCQKAGGDLVTIPDAKFDKYLRDGIGFSSNSYWIGLHEDVKSNNYVWLDEIFEPKYNNYGSAALRHIAGNQSCAVLDRTKWNVVQCMSLNYYMCQKVPYGSIDCPQGYAVYKKGITCLKLSDDRKEWEKAREYCQRDGGDLLQVPDSSTYKFVTDVIAKKKATYWIGLHDRQKNNDFHWLDSNDKVNFDYWDKDQPKDKEGLQNCVYINGVKDSRWLNDGCIVQRNYICQRPAFIDGKSSVKNANLLCPKGWTKYEAGQSCVKLNTEFKTWTGARKSCQSEGGDLIRIDSKNIKDFVSAYLKQTKTKSLPYIGLSNQVKIDEYTWLDEKTPAKYSNWLVGEPSRQADTCAVITVGLAYNYQWKDVSCSYRKSYLCQQKAMPPGGINCGSGWVDGPNSVYCYRVNEESLTWMDARASCKVQGGLLVSLVNQQEWFFLSGLMRTLQGTAYWTGGTSVGTGWEWTDKEPFAFFNWDSDQPSQNASKNYVAIQKDTGRWSAETWQVHMPSICKKTSKAFTPSEALNTTATPFQPGDDKQWGCRTKWTAYRKSCYRLLSFVPYSASWDYGFNKCKSLQSHYVTISDDKENSFVASLLQMRKFTGSAWIGLNDKRNRFKLSWSSDGAAMPAVTYTTWDKGEPANAGVENSCVIMKQNGKWANVACTGQQMGVICQKDMEILYKSEVDHTGCRKNTVAHYDKCYEVKIIPKTYDIASNDCRSARGNLATVSNHYVQSFLTSQLYGLKQFINKALWIGLSNRKQNSDSVYPYTWKSRGKVDVTYWDRTHTGTETNTCVAMQISPPAGLWHNYQCSEKLQYICEYARPGFTTPRPTTTTTSPLPCPSGWKGYSQMCYRAYSASRQKRKTWMEAKATCEGMVSGGTLVSITNSGIDTFLSRAVPYSGTYWIGLNDRDIEGGYKWSDGKPFLYEHWASNEPNNHENKEDCVTYNTYHKSWNDDNCYAVYNFICQAPRGAQLITTMTPPTIGPTVKQCGIGSWTMFQGYCYHFDRSYKTWYQAGDTCRSMGAQLTSIANLEENNFLTTLVHKEKMGDCWIGLSDLQDDKYKWVDGTLLRYLAWSPNEPNNYGGEQRCATMKQRKGSWDDRNCNEDLPFVCKKRPGSFSPITVAPTTPQKGGCPDNFHGIPGTSQCYYVGGIKKEDRKSFNDAKNACAGLHAKSRFASIHSDLDEEFVTTLVAALDTPAWIGLKNTDGYRWSDNTKTDYVYWGRNQPGGSWLFKNYGKCVDMMLTPKAAGYWRNGNCDQKLAYVCEHRKDVEYRQSPPNTDGCQNGYRRFRDSCYRYVSNTKSWSQSESSCVQDGGHLVSVQDRFEAVFLDVLIYSKPKPQIWIGLSDIGHSNYFTWSDGWPVLSTFWDSSQPDLNNLCVSHRQGPTWNTTDCNTKLPFVCEINFASPPVTSSSVHGRCPSGGLSWTKMGDSCYYVETKKIKTWPGANYACQLGGGQLASIHSAGEADGIAMFVGIEKVDAWIGLERTASGSFRWSDQTEAEYWRWASGSPVKTTAGQQQSCGFIQGFDGNWTNTDCFLNRGYLCKVKQTFPATTTQTTQTQSTVPITKSAGHTKTIHNNIVSVATKSTYGQTTTDQPSSTIAGSNLQGTLKGKSSDPHTARTAGLVSAAVAVVAVVITVVAVIRKRRASKPRSSTIGYENATYSCTENDGPSVQLHGTADA